MKYKALSRNTVIIGTLSICAAAMMVAAFIFVPSQHQALQAPPDVPQADQLLAALQQQAINESKEDVGARLRYETMMLADPATGSIPRGIREREQAYVNTLPTAPDPNDDALPNTRTNATDWESRGPFNIGGRTRALAIDVLDENTILAGGVSGGIWKSTDGGNTWRKTTAPGSLQSVTCITQDKRPGRENVWYYGTGEIRGNTARGGGAPFRGDGIFKSTDGGETWQQLAATSDGQVNLFNTQFRYVWNIATNPANLVQDELLAACFGGIVRSVDGGETWSVVLGDDLLNLPDTVNLNGVSTSFFADLTITDQGVMYATLSENTNQPDNSSATTKGLFRSENGTDWIDLTPRIFPERYRRTVIGVSPSNPNIVYFMTDIDDIDLRRYTFSGSGDDLTWRLALLGDNVPDFGGQVGDFDTQASYNMVIAVHPADPQVVYAGGINLLRSTDGFNSTNNITWIGGYTAPDDLGSYPNHHPDQHAVLFYPSDVNRMLSAHDGGVSRTQNNLADSVTWTSLNNGYLTSQFYAIDIDKSLASPIVVGGMQDNGSHITASSNFISNWARIIGGDGTFCAVADQAAYYYVSFQNNQVFRIRLNDDLTLRSFARVDPDGIGERENQGVLFVNPFELDPNNNNRMYMAGGDEVWRNDNLSQVPFINSNPTPVNWTDMARTSVEQGQVTTVSVSRLPANVVYYGTSAGQVFRIDNAASVDYAVTELFDDNFPEFGYVSRVAIDPTDASRILVVFSNYNVQSLFYSTDGGTTFEAVGGNLEENADGTGNGPSVRWAEVIPMQSGGPMYVLGTSTGVFSTSQLSGAATEWLREGEDVMGNVVVPMVRYRSTDGTIAVGTHGNGVYARQIDGGLLLQNAPVEPNFELVEIFPNSFSDITTIRVNVPEQGQVRVIIFNQQGQAIKTILWNEQFAGVTDLTWDGTNVNGIPVDNGIYLCRVEFGTQQVAERIILNR